MKFFARRIAVVVVYAFQVVLLHVSFAIFKVIKPRSLERKEWAVGLDEVAAHLYHISIALGSSVSVCLSQHAFYNYAYDYSLPAKIKQRYLRYLVRIIYSPLLLGYLCHRVNGIFYVAGSGFLLTEFDGRDYESRFLKARGLKIVGFFCGSEIRSLRLMDELSAKLGRDVITTYQKIVVQELASEFQEELRKKLAISTDRYADFIFTAPTDQISYIQRPTHPFINFYPDSDFKRNDAKFLAMNRVKVVHAPSSPLIKGTPLVRAAVKKLQLEGYDFEYRELIGVHNSVVLDALSQAHVVLNEFYAFVPGQFGVEAMASHCALVTSADQRIETSLSPGANAAWMVTEYWNIYDNLKRLLDHPALIRHYADAGFAWASEYCSCEKNGARLRKLLSAASIPPHA